MNELASAAEAEALIARYLPALLASIGARPAPAEQVCLEAAVDSHAVLTCFVPVRVRSDASARAMAHPVPVRTSGDFSSLPRTKACVSPCRGRTTATRWNCCSTWTCATA
jgi:molybdopterin molybdotransferase